MVIKVVRQDLVTEVARSMVKVEKGGGNGSTDATISCWPWTRPWYWDFFNVLWKKWFLNVLFINFKYRWIVKYIYVLNISRLNNHFQIKLNWSCSNFPTTTIGAPPPSPRSPSLPYQPLSAVNNRAGTSSSILIGAKTSLVATFYVFLIAIRLLKPPPSGNILFDQQ